MPQNQKNADVATQNILDTDLHKEPAGSSRSRLGSPYGQGKMVTSTSSHPKDSLVKKRKEPEEVVEESDLEDEEQSGDQIKAKNTESNASQGKRPRVETTDDFGEDFSVEDLESLEMEETTTVSFGRW